MNRKLVALALVAAVTPFSALAADATLRIPAGSLAERVFDAIPDILKAAGLIIGIASIVTAGTPTPDPASRLGKAYRLLEYMALVVGKAKDAGPPPAAPTGPGA